jgi:dehydrogenase/reductase SDR family member 7B
MPKSMASTILITGASSGIGKALALHYAQLGWQLALMARNTAKLQEVTDACEKLGAQVFNFTGDVSVEEDCKQFVDQTMARFGQINVLINNAGISMRGLFSQTDLSVLKNVMDINFWGTVYCTKYALPHLLLSKGSVVGVSSIAGFKGLPARTGYSSSKFAMQGFLESLRCENLETGLHVLIACPGYTESSIRENSLNADGQAQGKTPLNESKLMSAATVAARIEKAISQRKIYLILTTQGKLAVFINKWFPKLADRLTYNLVKKEPDSPF